MTVRIEAGAIIETNSVKTGRFKRLLTAWDAKFPFMQHTIFADTREELEIIDYENFMKE